jgi:RND family efflux transporter MFP subunit
MKIQQLLVVSVLFAIGGLVQAKAPVDENSEAGRVHEHEQALHAEDEHGHEVDGGEHAGVEGAAVLNHAQQALADIMVAPLQARQVEYQLYAPGELLSDGYTSYRVSPGVASVVIRRHVTLGEQVKKGQPLVTLISETVAEAQAAYHTAVPEWQRVRELGQKNVGEQRYLAARANLNAARARLRAFGLSAEDIEALSGSSAGSLGEYQLRAAIDGTVLSDNFEQGQRVEAGEAIIHLADERRLWVEAHMPANRPLTITEGTTAEVVAGGIRTSATVSQESHTIDPHTRTRTVRLLVDNASHRLHSGMYADVFFVFRTNEPVLAVPESALMRGADGDWTVFVEEHPGEFKPVEVELGRPFGKLREIRGVAEGTSTVMQGAFFVASQIAKGGFDPHNH